MGKGDKKSKKESVPWIEEKCRRCRKHRCSCKGDYSASSSSSSSGVSCASGACGLIQNAGAGQNSTTAQILNKSGLVCANGVCGVKPNVDNASGLNRQLYAPGVASSASVDAAKPDPRYVVKVGDQPCASCGNAAHAVNAHEKPRVLPYEQARLPPRKPGHPPGCKCYECTGFW